MEEANGKWLTALGPERVPYAEALRMQTTLWDRCSESGGRQNFLMLVEHPPVITIGRSGEPAEVLAPPRRLKALGVEVVETNRGGRVTFHGPGQLVMYPIVDLRGRGRDLHRYLRDLEGWLAELCTEYGLEAKRNPAGTGVWVAQNKIAAIGIAVRRWISYHGVALNVSTDLSYFDLIVPCGFSDRRVTSMARELGRRPPIEEVAEKALGLFCEHFDFSRVRHEPCVLPAEQKAG